MKKSDWKNLADKYEKRMDILWQKKALTQDIETKRQLQKRFEMIRELQKDALNNYHNFKKENK